MRHQANMLREKYARVFAVPLEDVELEDHGNNIYVWCPKHAGLPRWSVR